MEKWTVLYDGYCNLCSSSVQFILRNDRRKRFSYLPLQDEHARKLIAERGPESVVLVRGDRVYYRSTAALMIASRLRFPWPLFNIFFLVPRVLRDPVYNLVARNRKRWFGERSTCYVP